MLARKYSADFHADRIGAGWVCGAALARGSPETETCEQVGQELECAGISLEQMGQIMLDLYGRKC